MKWFITGAVMVMFMLPLPARAAGGEADQLHLGESLLAAGDYRKALKVFAEVVRRTPDSAMAHRGLGLARLKLGANEVMTDPALLDGAVAAFTAALQLRPDFAEVRYQLGLTWLALGNREGALREHEALARLDKELAGELAARIGTFKPPPSYREVGASREADDNLTRVSIIGNQVLVPVTIGHGDRTVQARLLLDTGASGTTISPEIASHLQMDLAKAEKTVGQVVGGGLVEGRAVKVSFLAVGPYTRSGMAVTVIPHHGPPVPFDGLLGMDFLRGLTYHVDFNRGLITWGR